MMVFTNGTLILVRFADLVRRQSNWRRHRSFHFSVSLVLLRSLFIFCTAFIFVLFQSNLKLKFMFIIGLISRTPRLHLFNPALNPFTPDVFGVRVVGSPEGRGKCK